MSALQQTWGIFEVGKLTNFANGIPCGYTSAVALRRSGVCEKIVYLVVPGLLQRREEGLDPPVDLGAFFSITGALDE